MNALELREEVFARGANYLEEDASGVARVDRWISESYQEILSLQTWPFLQDVAVASGSGLSVSVPTLRKIRFVTDVQGYDPSLPGRPLARATVESLVAEGELLSRGGTPHSYYVTSGNVVVPYPVGGLIRVDFIKRVPPLTGTEVPLFDSQYHDAIIDRVMVKVYKDSDNFEAGVAVKEEYNAVVSAMAEDYMVESREPEFIAPTGGDS